ncbi:hypothetical protein V6N12_068987 [Hibiscus sabdariffa]|uniref:RNase H type-1 domain-containing protein n=1 Tax=Hibiscus sabdariffa TaxID=183260 RepID=A0ABR2CAD4_9ROSI
MDIFPFVQVWLNRLPTPPATPTAHTQWKPPDDYIKINSDSSYNQESKSVDLGVVARDCCRLLLGGLAQHSPTYFDVLHVEFLAVQVGIMLARDNTGARNRLCNNC